MTIRFPKILFLIFILIICLLVIGFIILINLPSEEQKNEGVFPTPTTLPRGELRQGTSTIKPQSINPPENTEGTTVLNPSQKITYTLSESISPSTVTVKVSPSLPVKMKQGEKPNEVVVYPDPPEFWRPNILYTVTLFDEKNEIITSYQIKVPPIQVDEVRD